MSIVSTRYAKALLDLAIADNAVDDYQHELEAVSNIFISEREFTAFLLSPQKDLITKKNSILHVFSESVCKNVLHFILLLMDKGRIGLLPDIFSAYCNLADEYRKVVTVTVTTAFALDQVQINRIGETFKTVYHGSAVKITVETDRSLIGGIKVAVGDKLYDGTVKGKLKKMQAAIAGH